MDKKVIKFLAYGKPRSGKLKPCIAFHTAKVAPHLESVTPVGWISFILLHALSHVLCQDQDAAIVNKGNCVMEQNR